MDQARNAPTPQHQHWIDVRVADPGPEVKMWHRCARVTLAGPADGLAPLHGLALAHVHDR